MQPEVLEQAIRRAQAGDPGGFDVLVDAYGPRIYGLAYRLTGSRADAEDLLQEVMLRVVRRIGEYRHQGRFEAWLFRIAANLVRDRARRGCYQEVGGSQGNRGPVNGAGLSAAAQERQAPRRDKRSRPRLAHDDLLRRRPLSDGGQPAV